MTAAGRVAAERVHALLRQRGQTVAVAESLTGGLLAATLVDGPGASTTFRGGLVVYAADLKTRLAGVPARLLEEAGPVDEAVALHLAEGAARACLATWGVATTGVAGPGPQDGHPAGTVWVAVAGPAGASARRLSLTGPRRRVRSATVAAALRLLADQLTPPAP